MGATANVIEMFLCSMWVVKPDRYDRWWPATGWPPRQVRHERPARDPRLHPDGFPPSLTAQEAARSFVRASRLAVEHGPAVFVAQPLIVEHEFSDLAGELCTLPEALQAASFLTLTIMSRRACGPDRVGR